MSAKQYNNLVVTNSYMDGFGFIFECGCTCNQIKTVYAKKKYYLKQHFFASKEKGKFIIHQKMYIYLMNTSFYE